MDTIIKSRNNQQLIYDPAISSNSVIPANQSSVQQYQEIYLKVLNYLSEYKTYEQKKAVRDNINVYDKGTVDIISKKVDKLRQDLGNMEDSPNQEGNAFERINYLVEIIIQLTGENEGSIAWQIKEAVSDLKGGVSSEYDTLKKIEDIIKAHLQDYNNPHQVTKEQVGLANVDNTADTDKPVSDATQALIDSTKNELNSSISSHVENKDNPHDVTKAQVGLDQVDNTSDLNKPVSTAQQEAINTAKEEINQVLTSHTSNTSNPHNVTKEQIGLSNVTNDSQVKRVEMGVASGVATLGEDGKVPASQLPSYVDDVVEIQKTIDTKASIPSSGLVVGQIFYVIDEKKFYIADSESTVGTEGTTPEVGKIYVAVADNNKQYRWAGNDAGLVQITSGNLVIGEAEGTAYDGLKGKQNRDAIKSLPSTIISQVSEVTTSADSVNLGIKKVTKSEINYGSEEDQDVIISPATISTAGVMTSTDKINLENVITKVNKLDWAIKVKSVPQKLIDIMKNYDGTSPSDSDIEEIINYFNDEGVVMLSLQDNQVITFRKDDGFSYSLIPFCANTTKVDSTTNVQLFFNEISTPSKNIKCIIQLTDQQGVKSFNTVTYINSTEKIDNGINISYTKSVNLSDSQVSIDLINNGDGTKFLSDNGQYIEVSGGGGGGTVTDERVVSSSLVGYIESTESNENLDLTTDDTIVGAFGKLTKAIKDNELVGSSAINKLKDSIGLDENLEFSTTAGDTTVVEAIERLSNNSSVGEKYGNAGEIFNDYDNNKAPGAKSHAEGGNTSANGDYSHSEGYYNISSGKYSHTEGSYNVTSGVSSHVEGGGNLGELLKSSMGITNVSDNGTSIRVSDGVFTSSYLGSNLVLVSKTTNEQFDVTLKTRAFVSGSSYDLTIYETIYSQHPLSRLTTGSYDVYLGTDNKQNISSGDFSHTEGSSNYLTGIHSHVEGINNLVYGENSHAEGNFNKVTRNNSHAEGSFNIASGNNSHTEGGILIDDLTKVYVDEINISEGTMNIDPIEVSDLGTRFLISRNNVFKFNIVNCTFISGSKYKVTLQNGVQVLVGDGTNGLKNGYYYYSSIQPNIASGVSSHSEGRGSSSSGDYSHAEGFSNASGNYSHAEGYNTTASGNYSHSEGSNTVASGSWSHTEGDRTTASGSNSHAEGFSTAAFEQASHVEGYNTKSFGKYSHAEGNVTETVGESSHAEGNYNVAFGENSHAEGKGVASIGLSSHAEGASTFVESKSIYISSIDTENNQIICNRTFENRLGHYLKFNYPKDKIYKIINYEYVDEGNRKITLDTVSGLSTKDTSEYLLLGNYASGTASHTEGMDNRATGACSHSEGEETTASGEASHSEGLRTNSSSQAAHAEGYQSKASGLYSHAEGQSTKANGIGSHAEGQLSEANGEWSHAEGYQSKAIGTSSHAEGYSKASDTYAHSEGSGTEASGSASHSEGISTKASGYSAHSEGTSTIASGGHSHAEGEGTKAINNWTHAEGFSSIASGEASHAEGSETESSGIKSHAEGQLSKAIGEQSHAEGYQTLAIGNYSHAEGGGAVPVDESFYTKTELEIYDEWVRLYKTPTVYDTGDGFSMAKGKGSHVEGKNNLALGDYSHVEGEKNVDLYGHNHIEGYDNLCESSYCHIEGMYNSTGDAGASCCHIEGSHNIAYQPYEHAEGCFNVSNFGMGTEKDSTIHSVGIGSSSQRKNAHEIMMNGDHYVYGIGGYNGANYSNAKTLQQVLNPITEYKKFTNLKLYGHNDYKFVFLLFKINSASSEKNFILSGKLISPGYSSLGIPPRVINIDACSNIDDGIPAYSYGYVTWKGEGSSGSTVRVVECMYNGEKYLALDIFVNGEFLQFGTYFIGICNQDSIIGTDIDYYYAATGTVENSEINNSIEEV